MKTAALYVRVSTDAQYEEGYSVETQKELLAAYCVAKEIAQTEFYVDGGYSGSNLDRPAMQKMIADIRAGLVDRVVVYKLDRLSRSQKDTLYLIEDVFNACGVGFSSLNENFDTTTPVGKAMLGMMSVFAQLERETIRERTRMGMAARVREGLWPGGGRPPFGYLYDSAQGILVPDENAPVVRTCFQMFLAGKSAEAIARELGFPYDLTVRNLLSRVTYTGKIEYKGQIYPGRHQPLISDEIFQQARREFRRRSGSRGRDGGHLLSGLLTCGLCGAAMRYQKWGDKGYKFICYSQQSYKPYMVKDPNCPQEKLWAEDVEREVISLLRVRTVRHGSEDGEGADQEPDYEARLRRENAKLSRLYNLYAEGDDALLSIISEKKKAIEELRERIARRDARLRDGEAAKAREEKLTDILSAWESLTHEEQRSVIRACVRRVTLVHERIDIDFII